MYSFDDIKQQLKDSPKVWLITGAAGFIGSNLVEYLLAINQKVIGLDNLFSGKLLNIENIKNINFKFYNIDITDYSSCKKIFENSKIDFVLHHAAIASVPLSIADPKLTSSVNIDGFVNILDLSKDFKIKAFVYASSSAVYGDNQNLKKIENNIGKFLSPYAVSKYTNELYATQYSDYYHLKAIGLRYFNVYGKNQDPNSAYSAVIPKWMNSILQNQQIYIYGDGSSTRDFCSIENVIQANILSCFNYNKINNIYNIGIGESISLNYLLTCMIGLAEKYNIRYKHKPVYQDFNQGDIKHSCADISLAKKYLNYEVNNNFLMGLEDLFKWFIDKN